jgi:hypothetical protein
MSEEERELEALRESVQRAAPELPIADLIPIFVPSNFFALGNWPGPYEVLQVPGLGLTWAVLQPGQTMRYVDREVQAHWETQHIAWRDRALQNLRHRSGEQPWTHEFRQDGGALFAVGMMHPDGTGPSRLLLREALKQAFPAGYSVALPEMSCAVALSAHSSDAERAKIDAIVDQCFAGGARPLVRGMHDPALLRDASHHG